MAGILNPAWQAVDRFVPDEQVRGVFGRAAPQAQPGQAPPQRQGPTMGQYVQGFIGGHMPAVVRGAYDQVQAQKKQTAADMDEIERLERRGVPSEIAAMLRLDPKSGLEALGKWLEPRTLGEGQTLTNVDVALPRGSVIAGRITDEFGEPIAMAQVQAQRYQYRPGGQRRLTFAGGPFVMTDDLGQFRVYGLMPGE